jgi:hypothetical protein
MLQRSRRIDKLLFSILLGLIAETRGVTCVRFYLRLRPIVAAVGSLGFMLAVASGALGATNFTWSGAAPVGAGASNWSQLTDWAGGSAPSGAVGALAFPELTTPGCIPSPAIDSCYASNNDLTGISASSLSIVGPYGVSGNAITLGSGGLSATNPNSAGGTINVANLSLPISMTAGQTWTLGTAEALQVASNLTGSTVPWTLQGAGASSGLSELGDTEVGAVSVNNAQLRLDASGASVNGSDGNPVALSNGAGLFVDSAATVGALSITNGILSGRGSPAVSLTVNGGVTLSPSTSVFANILQAGTTAGTDYSQTTATGPIDLAGASLTILAGNGSCPTLNVGDVDTLGKTSGSLQGTFSGVPDGTVLALSGCTGTPPTIRLNYTSDSITATVLTAGSSQAPQTSSLAVAPTGSGSGTITSSDGKISCPGTCTASYPAGSQVVLSAAPAAGSSFNGWSGGGCSGTGPCTVALATDQSITATFLSTAPVMPTTTTPPSSPTTTAPGSASVPANPTAAKIRSALATVLTATGPTAKIARLFKAKGYTLAFTAPSRGTLTIAWYAAARQAGATKKAKAIVIASATHRFTNAGKATIKLILTAKGRALLKHAHRIRLTARASFTPTGLPRTTSAKTITLTR